MLWLVATPIGDTDEITLRALDILKTADAIICESTKEASKLLKVHEIKAQAYEVLNEHTDAEDLNALALLCENQNVALVTDCGTPSFSDPGFQLVDLCRKKNIKIRTALGASSLMGLISLSSQHIKTFYFRGFLPAETVARQSELQKLSKFSEPIVLMDTPYRFKKSLAEVSTTFSNRKILVVMNLSDPELETVWEGTGLALQKWQPPFEKAEFMILIYSLFPN